MAKKRNQCDKRFKNAVIKWLMKNGFHHPSSGVHYKFKSVKVINTPTDLEGITTDGIVFRFEVKGHYVNKEKNALVTAFFDEVKEGVDNPDNTFYILIRKEKNKYLNPLFYTINQILKLLALQKPQLKGTIDISDGITQEDIDKDEIKYPNRREETLVADKNMIRGLDKTFSKLKNNKITNKTGVNMNNQSPLLMDTILYGATLGNKEGVEAIVSMYSNNNVSKYTKNNKSPKPNKDAMINKKSYFTSEFIDADNEPTESIKSVMMNRFDKDEDVAKDISRFYSSKIATDLMNNYVRLVNTGVGKSAAERYHLKVSDVNSYLN